MPGKFAVLAFVDEALGMLDPRAHGKGLLDHVHPGLKQHLLGVRRAVADGHDQGVGGNFMFPRFVRICHGFHLSGPGLDLREPGVEQHLAAQGKDFLPDGGHHLGQPVRADVGPG